MTDILIAFALGAAPMAAAFFFVQRDRRHERAAFDVREQKLLDRLMARDLTEYKTHEPRPDVPERGVTEEERRQTIEDARLLDGAHGLS